MSITFDGGFKGQDLAAAILKKHDMAGTFYVNSGYIDFPAYLSQEDLRKIARARSEIGGASLYGSDIRTDPAKQAKAEVCDDRATLTHLGYQITSFAYPHGRGDSVEVKTFAQACGYNSGRDLSGLYDASDCSSCPAGETLPVTDDFRIRTPPPTNDVATLKKYVTHAEANGGGWVPLVFGRICICPSVPDAITPEDFEAFLGWLQARPDSTTVKTIDEVMAGPLEAAVGKPLDRLVLNPSMKKATTPKSAQPAVTLLGFGIGQSQVLMTGMLIAIAIVATYRIASRGNRYARR